MAKLNCHVCRSAGARRYQLLSFGASGEAHAESELILCTGCARAARAERRRSVDLPATEARPDCPDCPDSPDRPDCSYWLTRRELITELDRFFEASGAFEICRRCHEQGTGCCPPTCRVRGAQGCDAGNRYGKTLFCAAFVCGALLNAISECDPEIGRTIKRMKREFGPAEFHIYEMITRVPSSAREGVQPLALPDRYPGPVGLDRGDEIKEKLSALADEVLEIRRRWHELEKLEDSFQ
jgi:hypothetical protein